MYWIESEGGQDKVQVEKALNYPKASLMPSTGFCGSVDYETFALAIFGAVNYSKCQWRDHRLQALLANSSHHVSFADIRPTKKGSRQVSLGAFVHNFTIVPTDDLEQFLSILRFEYREKLVEPPFHLEQHG